MGATGSRTGIHAFVPDTGQVCGTLLVDGALRFTLSVWVTQQARDTGASSCPAPLFADSINPTGTRSAGVNYLRSDGCC